jgi:hypothetical protein
MKPFLSGVCFLGLAVLVSAQDTLREISIQIPVQVRVYSEGMFVDNLGLDDFELYEGGKRQRIEAVYHVREKGLTNLGPQVSLVPDISRSFYLFFEIADYTPELRASVRYFVQEVVRPSDSLTIITPKHAYRLKKTAPQNIPKAELTRQLDALFERDTLLSNPEYRAAVAELKALVSLAVDPDSKGAQGPELGGQAPPSGMSWDAVITRYSSLLTAVEKLRKIDERRLLDYVEMLRYQEGQKFAFFFYQREPLPRIAAKLLDDYIRLNQGRRDVIRTLTYMQNFHNRDFHVDEERLARAFASASILLHFVVFDMPETDGLTDIEARNLTDFYGRLEAISSLSGASFPRDLTALELLKEAVGRLDQYYLVYYTPSYYAGDGKFKSIEVRVKDRQYRLVHRAGYVSE